MEHRHRVFDGRGDGGHAFSLVGMVRGAGEGEEDVVEAGVWMHADGCGASSVADVIRGCAEAVGGAVGGDLAGPWPSGPWTMGPRNPRGT